MDRDTLWLQVESLVMGLIDEHGETRNSLGPKLGLSRNHLGRYLMTEEQRRRRMQIRPAFDLAFQIADHFGLRPASLLAPFATDSPEVLLRVLPCKTDRFVDSKILSAFSQVGACIAVQPSSLDSLWPERRKIESELAQVYTKLADLEERRHYEAEAVAALCRQELTETEIGSSVQLFVGESVRLVGLIGIWGSIQRCRNKLRSAREAIRHSLSLARRLGDRSLYANQLQRSAYVFRELGAPELAVRVLREASEHYRADENELGAVHTLIDRAVMAANRNDISFAERLYSAGLNLLPDSDRSPYRALAAQGLATCRDLRGDVSGALAFLNVAAKEADSRDRRLRALLMWTAANIERRLRHFDEANAKYWEALRIFEELRFPDLIVRLALDLAISLALSGQAADLKKLNRVVLRTLPSAKKAGTLRRQLELLLRELARDSPSAADLKELRLDFEGKSRRR